MYVNGNPKTKKALKEMVAAGTATVFSNDLFNSTVPDNGTVYLEGPHFPEPHKWYAQGTMRDGKLVAVK